MAFCHLNACHTEWPLQSPFFVTTFPWNCTPSKWNPGPAFLFLPLWSFPLLFPLPFPFFSLLFFSLPLPLPPLEPSSPSQGQGQGRRKTVTRNGDGQCMGSGSISSGSGSRMSCMFVLYALDVLYMRTDIMIKTNMARRDSTIYNSKSHCSQAPFALPCLHFWRVHVAATTGL